MDEKNIEPHADASRAKRLAAFAFLFTLTGLGGLVLEVVWQRRLSLLFGNTVEATGAVLAAFLGTLAIGSAIVGPIADRVRNPLRLYGVLEILTGAGALVSLVLSEWVGELGAVAFRTFGGESPLLTVSRCLLAVLLVAPATVPMGGTLPAISAGLVRERRTGETLGLLYGLNTIGAAAGAALSAFVFILFLGIRATWISVGVLDITIGLVVLAVAGRGLLGSDDPPAADDAASDAPVAGHDDATAAASASSRAYAALLVIALTSGAVVLGLEVLWTRALVLHLGSQVASFALVLATVLLGLGAGSLVGGRLSEIVADRLTLIGLFAVAAAAAAALSVSSLRGLSEFLGNLGAMLQVQSYWGTVLLQTLTAFRVILLPSFLAGCIMPIAMREAYARGQVGKRLGFLVAASTAGTLIGSLGAAFALVPIFGVGRSFAILVTVELAVGCVVLVARRRPAAIAAGATAAVASVALLMSASPLSEVLLKAGIFTGGNTTLLHSEDGLHGLITVEEVDDGREVYLSLAINGVNVAGTARELVVVQKLQAHVPLLVHPDPKSILHIGIGSGGTAASAATHALEKIDIVELNPRVPEASDEYFRDVNHGLLFTEPRIDIIYGDGRTLLLASDQKYDVILSDSVHPRFAGNGALYTRDYYEQCKLRLNEGGVVSQWLPLYSLPPEAYQGIVRAFLDVFPHAALWFPHDTLNPNSILIGSVDELQFSTASLRRRLAVQTVAEDLAEIDIFTPTDFLAHYVAGSDGLRRLVADATPHTDDHPVVEYAAGRFHGDHYANYRTWTWKENFRQMLAIREPIEDSLPELAPLAPKLRGYLSELEKHSQ